jgi:hypothetical protein
VKRRPAVQDESHDRYSRYVGKTVYFNWGRQIQEGKLLAWNSMYQRATIELIYKGKRVRLELKLGRTTGFAVAKD